MIVALYDKRGKVNGFSTVTRDLTERKRTEESQNKPDTEIQYAQKLDSLAILAGGMIVGCIGGLIAARSAREIAD